MKLVQLNVWCGRLLYAPLRFLQREQADILCLQEVTDAPRKTYLFDIYKDIQSHLAYPYVSYAPCLSLDCMGMAVAFGNAIFSRLPFTHTDVHRPNGPFVEHFQINDDLSQPNVNQIARVEVAGKPLDLINTHGFLVKNGYVGDERTMRQMDMAADHVQNAPGAVIMAGDLNLAPESPSLRRLNGQMRNLVTEYGVTTTRNDYSWMTDVVTDYIFVNERIRVNDFHVAPDLVSDHQALVLDFDVIG